MLSLCDVLPIVGNWGSIHKVVQKSCLYLDLRIMKLSCGYPHLCNTPLKYSFQYKVEQLPW